MAKKRKKVSEPGAGDISARVRGKRGNVTVVDDATAVTPKAARPSRGDRGRRRAQEEPIVFGSSDLTIGDETGEQHAVAPRIHGGHGDVDPEAAVTQVEIPALPASAGLLAEPGASGAAPDDSAIDEVRAVQVVPDEPPPAPTRRVMARGRRPGRTDDLPDDLRDLEPTILDDDSVDDDSVDDVSLDDPEDFLAGDASIEAGPDTGEHPAASGVGATGTEVAEVQDIADTELMPDDGEPEAKLPTIVDLAFELKDRWKLAGDGYYYCYDRNEKEVYRIGVTEASRSESGEAVFEAQVVGGINNGAVATVAVDALRDSAQIKLFHPDKYTVGNARFIGMVDNISSSVATAVAQAREGRTTSVNLDRLSTTLRMWKDGYAAAVKDVSGIGERRWKELVSLCDAEASGVKGIGSLLRHFEKGKGQPPFLVNEKTKEFLKDFENFFRVIQQAFGRYKSGEFDLAPLEGVRTEEQAARSIDFNTIHREWKELQQRARNISDLGAAGALYHSRYTDMVLPVMEMLRVLNDDRPRVKELDNALREHGGNLLSIIRMLFNAAKQYQEEEVARASAATPPRGLSDVTPPFGAPPVVPHELTRTQPFGVPVMGRSVEHGAGTTGEMHAVREAMPPVAEPSAAEQLEARWDAFVEAWPTAGGERYLITHLKGEPPSAQHKYGLADGPQRILRLLSPHDLLYRPGQLDSVSFQDVTPPLWNGKELMIVTLTKREVMESKERVNVLYDEQLNADKFEGLQQRMQQHLLDMRTFVLNRCLEGFVGPDQQLDLEYLGSDRYHDRLRRLEELSAGIVAQLDGLSSIDNIYSIPLRTVTHGIYFNTDFAIKLPEFFVATDDIVDHIAEFGDALQLPVVRRSIEMITQLNERVTRGSFTTEELANFQIGLNDLSNDIFDADIERSLTNILYPTLKALLSYMSLECMSREWVQPPNDPLSKALRDLSIATQMNVVNVAVGRVSKITEAAQRAPRTASTPGTAPAPRMARRVTPYPGVSPVGVEHADVSGEELRSLLADQEDGSRPHGRPGDARGPLLSPEELDALRRAVEMSDEEAERWAGEDPAVSELELDEEDDAQAETQPSVPAVVGPLDRRSRLEARQRRRDTRAVSAERLAQEPTWDAVLQPHTEMRNVSGTMRVQVVSVKGDTVTMFGQLSDGTGAHLTYTRPSTILWLERNGFSPRSVVEPVTE